jgi:DNA-binding GntR family transcriptional regulator
MEDRDYGAGGNICPLFFDGAVSTFAELPLPDNVEELNEVYRYIDELNNSKNTLLFTFNKHFNNTFVKNKINNYFCKLLNRIKNEIWQKY